MPVEPVPAGTVLFLDFNALGFSKPEMEGGHPVLVLSPLVKQKNGTAIVVPLTSELGNFDNCDAVEITHQGMVFASATKRCFAVCDKPIAVALTRLDDYTPMRRPGRNYMPRFRVRGEELKFVRTAAMRAMSADSDFIDLLRNDHSELRENMRLRLNSSKKLGRVSGPLIDLKARSRRAGAYKSRPKPGRG